MVFNACGAGEIEVIKRPSDQKEVAFRLKTATDDQPFALIKIGDIAAFLKDELVGYEIIEGFDNEGYFERLDEDDSGINILMGSRTFYEGWDSNRPNVMCFVNIGQSTEARKFILQSVGRGVRIEPFPDVRKRLRWLFNAGDVPRDTFAQIQKLGDPRTLPIETLFIFGTNRSALQFVIEQLDRVERKDTAKTLKLDRNEEQLMGCRLLIPVFKVADHLLAEEREPSYFKTTPEELNLLKTYVNAVADQVLLARHGLEPQKIDLLRHSLQNSDTYYNLNGQAVGHLDLLVQRAGDYFAVIPRDFERLKDLDDEIQHFQHIKVTLRDIEELRQTIDDVKEYPSEAAALDAQYGQISPKEYMRKAQKLKPFEYFESDGQRIKIEYIAEHYYIPTILAQSQRVDYIKHIVRVKSEVGFINHLNDYAQKPDNLLNTEFDWWIFSKLDEHLDEIGLPYYDPVPNRIRSFKPDFIFWMKRGNDYYIIFVDPKGTAYADYQHKIDGYRRLFEDENGECRIVHHEGLNVRVFTFLHTEDKQDVGDEYRPYWFDRIEPMLKQVLRSSA
jgi:hypothetical protein